MTDTTHTPEENLDFLRQLAHAGKEAPLMAGPYLIAGGAWFAAASLLQWPPLRDLLGLSLTQATLAWLIAAAGFALHLFVLIRRDHHKVENSVNRVVNASWMGVGLGIFAFGLGVAAVAWQRGDAFVMSTISLQVLSVYGIAWMIAGAAAGARLDEGQRVLRAAHRAGAGPVRRHGTRLPGLCDRAGAAGCRAGRQAVAAGPARQGLTP